MILLKERAHFNTLLQLNQSTGEINCYNMTVSDEPKLVVEMYDRQAKLTSTFREWRADQGIRWIVGYANYVNQNYFNMHNKFSTRSYTKGTIMNIDFFGGFGNELIYDHPAIVLLDLGTGLIVAPLTSTPSVYADAVNQPLHIRLIKKVPSYGDLNKDSTIKLDQLRYISKKRILYKISRVSDRGILNEIEKALMSGLANYSYKKMEDDLKDTNQLLLNLTNEKEVLETEKITLMLENDLLNQEILSLQLQLKEQLEPRKAELTSEAKS